MGMVRICYVLELIVGGLWGSGQGGLEADVTTTTCKHGSGKDALCIPHTYIKGLLRRVLEEIEDHLYRLKIVNRNNIVDRIFGPLTLIKGEVQGVPSRIIIPPLFPVKGLNIASELAIGPPLTYLFRGDILADVELYVEPHVRIDDVLETATIGALYKELKVTPKTLFYGEVLFYTEDENEACDVLRALSIAIAALRLHYAGRRSVVQPKILSVTYNNKDMSSDNIVNFIMNLLSSSRTMG